jgi:hypothetical protein
MSSKLYGDLIITKSTVGLGSLTLEDSITLTGTSGLIQTTDVSALLVVQSINNVTLTSTAGETIILGATGASLKATTGIATIEGPAVSLKGPTAFDSVATFTAQTIHNGGANIVGDLSISNDATISGDIYINGNLEVNGTTTTINTVDMSITDPILELNSAAANFPSTALAFTRYHDSVADDTPIHSTVPSVAVPISGTTVTLASEHSAAYDYKGHIIKLEEGGQSQIKMVMSYNIGTKQVTFDTASDNAFAVTAVVTIFDRSCGVLTFSEVEDKFILGYTTCGLNASVGVITTQLADINLANVTSTSLSGGSSGLNITDSDININTSASAGSDSAILFNRSNEDVSLDTPILTTTPVVSVSNGTTSVQLATEHDTSYDYTGCVIRLNTAGDTQVFTISAYNPANKTATLSSATIYLYPVTTVVTIYDKSKSALMFDETNDRFSLRYAHKATIETSALASLEVGAIDCTSITAPGLGSTTLTVPGQTLIGAPVAITGMPTRGCFSVHVRDDASTGAVVSMMISKSTASESDGIVFSVASSAATGASTEAISIVWPANASPSVYFDPIGATNSNRTLSVKYLGI